MKRTTIIYLIVLVALVGVAAILYMQRSESTLPEGLQDFAVEDTASITKINLSDKKGNTVSLRRIAPSVWLVNDKYKAEKVQVDLLLETIKRVRVKNPVPLAARDEVIRNLATTATRIQIYHNDDLLKTYYVGGTTPDELGTLMLIENSPQPFVTHIPGFNGYLSTRYISKERDWRTTEIFNIDPISIRQVKLEYPGNPEWSFQLRVQGESFYLQQLNPTGPEKVLNRIQAIKYLSGYRKIHFEQFAQLGQLQKDSVAGQMPFAIFSITTDKGLQPALRLFHKKADVRTKGVGKDNLDLDLFYGTLGDNTTDMMLVQRYVARPLLITFEELATHVEK